MRESERERKGRGERFIDRQQKGYRESVERNTEGNGERKTKVVLISTEFLYFTIFL